MTTFHDASDALRRDTLQGQHRRRLNHRATRTPDDHTHTLLALLNQLAQGEYSPEWKTSHRARLAGQIQDEAALLLEAIDRAQTVDVAAGDDEEATAA